jgi:valyl-tRNA synthetase
MPDLVFKDLIQQMSNVKVVKTVNKKPKSRNMKISELNMCQLILDLEDTPELQEERIIRDLLRTIQNLRKKSGLKTGDPISLKLATPDEFVQSSLENHKTQIISKVSAENFEIIKGELVKNPDLIHYDFHLCTNGKCYSSIREKHVVKIIEGKQYVCNYCGKQITIDQLGKIQISFGNK